MRARILRALPVATLALFLSRPPALAAQEPTPPEPAAAPPAAEAPAEPAPQAQASLDDALALLEQLEANPSETIRAAVRGLDPNDLNGLLDKLAPASGLGNFLQDVNFRFKTFEDENSDVALGFDFDFSKSVMRESSDDPRATSFLNLLLTGRGNVAFERQVNPHDELDFALELHWFGRSSSHTDHAKALQAIEGLSYEDVWAGWAAEDLDPDEIEATTEFAKLEEFMRYYVGRELLWDLSAHAAIESNQDFSSTQAAYGVRAGATLRDWDEQRSLSRFNLFDYPFALLRTMTGMDEQFSPSGLHLPSLALGLDLVDPQDNDARSAIGEDDPYVRWNLELSMRSRIAEFEDGWAFVSLGLRHYEELDAPSAVENAELDDSTYFAASLDLPNGWFLRYATGNLPLDQQNDDVFELGFAYSF